MGYTEGLEYANRKIAALDRIGLQLERQNDLKEYELMVYMEMLMHDRKDIYGFDGPDNGVVRNEIIKWNGESNGIK